jgi:TRAP-type C4-dicarboxylate transport system substrate-binding protein
MRRAVLSAMVAAHAAAALLLSQVSLAAAPRTLTLSYASSDRSVAYLSLVKPFVDAINNDPRDLLKIVVRFSGQAGPLKQQPSLVSVGKIDIAFILPGIDPKLFPDETAVELPGLFRDTREASLVHTRLVAANALSGYRNFHVIGAVATQPETIHSRKPTASLADLKGQTLRVNNPIGGAAIGALGAAFKVMTLNDTADAISSGAVNGAVVQLGQLADFGVGRLVSHHYLLPVSSAPLALVMNRKVFAGLTEAAKTLIREHSGAWLAERYIAIANAANQRVLDQLRADKRRTVTVPTPADLQTAQRVYAAVTEQWAAARPHNRELLARVRAEIAKLEQRK